MCFSLVFHFYIFCIVVKSKNFWVQFGENICYRVFKERLNLWRLAWGKELWQRFGHFKCIDQRESDKLFWLKVKRREMLVISGSLVFEEKGRFLLLIWHRFPATFRWFNEVEKSSVKTSIEGHLWLKEINVFDQLFCDLSLAERIISNGNHICSLNIWDLTEVP